MSCTYGDVKSLLGEGTVFQSTGFYTTISYVSENESELQLVFYPPTQEKTSTSFTDDWILDTINIDNYTKV